MQWGQAQRSQLGAGVQMVQLSSVSHAKEREDSERL